MKRMLAVIVLLATALPLGAQAGTYKNLLRTLEVPEDACTYGQSYEWGYWSGDYYAGYDELPEGYWVYDGENWMIYEACEDCEPEPEPVCPH